MVHRIDVGHISDDEVENATADGDRLVTRSCLFDIFLNCDSRSHTFVNLTGGHLRLLECDDERVLVEDLLDLVLGEQLQNLVLDRLQSLLIAIHRSYELLALCLDFRLLLDYDITEQLFLKTLLRDGKVDQSNFDANFRRVVRVRHFCRHEQLKVFTERVRFFLVKFDFPSAIFVKEFLVKEDWINRGINILV